MRDVGAASSHVFVQLLEFVTIAPNGEVGDLYLFPAASWAATLAIRSKGISLASGNFNVPLPDRYGAISAAKPSSPRGTGYTEMWCAQAAKYTT
ncbi:UNVERIFIED_CONTAM: hypothetical protein ABIE34_001881 [Jeotgalibacillus campisalis]